MIQITPPQNPQYWINQRALTFSENDLENVNRIAVSLVSGTVIMVYEKGVIDYAPDGNFQKWALKGYSTRLVSDLAHHIYARLSRTEKDALIVFSINNYNIDGSITTIVTDASGNPVLDEDGKKQTTTSEPNPNYWYVKIGEITATVGNSKRELTYDSGALGTKKGDAETGSWTDMFELSKESTPWLIFVKQMFYEFTVKNPITLLGGLIFKDKDGLEKKIVDIKRSTDSDADVPIDDYSIPTTAYVKSMSEDRYLKKYEPDETEHKIKFYDGIEAGHFVKGMIGGSGTQFDGNGYGEMNGLTLREFLEVPELRFNRIDVVSGELWNSISFGLVESVDTEKRICKIKLEENERCGLHVYDICRGIFADFGNGTQWEGVDECGFLHLYGFYTSYFTPTKILENEEGIFSFQYELKEGTMRHPCQSMKFAVYGNFLDSSRQASAYSTRTYKRYLNNVNTWVIDPDKHIYAQYGNLEGLTIGSVEMHGYGSFQSNAYFKGTQIQLTPSQLQSLKGESAYTAVLSDYEGVVVIDGEGNIVGGEMEALNVVSEGENVITSGQNVITTGYRLKTEVYAMRGETPLFYSHTSPVEDSYILGLKSIGCSAMVVNGVVIVTSVMDTDRCYVDITVNCEGNASFNLTYHITAVRDGKNPIIADIDNEMDSVACDSNGKVIFGLPVRCKVSMWAGVKQLVLDRLLMELPSGVTATADKNSGLVTVTGISDDAERTLPINLTAYATYGGIQYHRELIFTVNKVNAGENALLYKLSPSVSAVKVDDEGVMTASSVSCELVAVNGIHTETLKELPEGVSMEYFLDKDTPSAYEYNTPIGINDGNKTVTFKLYSNSSMIDVETIPILIDGRSPVVLDLDNEMHSVACDENGKVVLLPEISSNVQMYWGSKKLETKIVELIKPVGVAASFNGTTVTVTDVSDNAADTLRLGIIASAMYGETTYRQTAYMVINKIRQGNSAVVLDLVPSVSAIKIDKRGGCHPSQISCRTKMTTGKNGVTEPDALQNNYSLRYVIDDSISEEPYSYGKNISVVSAKTSVTFRLYYSEDNGISKPWKLVDRETVPVLIDAADAFKSTVFCRSNGKVSVPTGGTYESPIPENKDNNGNLIWSDGIPSGDSILWASVRTFTTDGKEPQDETWSLPSQMTDTASFEVVYNESTSKPNPPTNYPGSPGSWNPDNGWMDNSTENSIWMATAIKTNGEWSDWQISKVKGETGAAGVGIDKVEEFYLAWPYNTGVTVSTSGWDSKMPTLDATNKYLWNYEKVTYSNGKDDDSTPVVIGTFSKDGKGISSIVEYYAKSKAVNTVPSSWDKKPPTLDAVEKYLWNYEQVFYTDGSNSETDPVIIGAYGDTGAAGVGIDKVEEFYLAWPYNTGVTVSTSGWDSKMPTLNSSDKYLWNYEKVTYSNGEYDESNPVVIGTFSKDGKGISSIVEYYAKNADVNSSPSSWDVKPPTLDAVEKYLWNYEEIYYTDGTKSYTEPIIIGSYGDKGSPGDNACTYTVEPKITNIHKSNTGTLSPESITFTCYKDTGVSDRVEETALWQVEYTNTPDEESSWTVWSSMSSISNYKARHTVVFSVSYNYYRITAYPYSSRPYTFTLQVVSDGSDGGTGGPGPRGAMPRYCGEFVPGRGVEYVYNSEYRDIVVYQGNVYQVWSFGTTVTETPDTEMSDGYNDGYWEKAGKYSFVAMDTALIDGANIAGFQFKSSKMVSQYGHLVLDGINGVLECDDVNLSGTINATSGTFTSGTFTDVTFETGRLAGFNVSSNSITSDLGAYSGGSGLESYPDSKFYLYASGYGSANLGYSSTYRRSSIGLNTYPNLTNSAALGMFTDTQEPEVYQEKIGLYISIEGGNNYSNGYLRNSALYIPKGHISGFRRRLFRTSISAKITIYDSIIVCTNTSEITITLPSEVEDGQEYWMISANSGSVKVVDPNTSNQITNSGGNFSTKRWHVYIFDAYNKKWHYSYMNY